MRILLYFSEYEKTEYELFDNSFEKIKKLREEMY